MQGCSTMTLVRAWLAAEKKERDHLDMQRLGDEDE
jgi:hypothetical protein